MKSLILQFREEKLRIGLKLDEKLSMISKILILKLQLCFKSLKNRKQPLISCRDNGGYG